MLFSDEYICEYITKQIDRIENKLLRKSNIYRYAMYRYKKKCIFSINKKKYNETRDFMRKSLLKQLCLNLLDEKYKKIISESIPTATYL